jgi:serine/threonine-protein kinase
VAFELLTGRLPFEHDDRARIADMHLTEVPPLPSQLRRDLTTAFDALLLRALEKDARWRVPTATRFSAMLERAVERARTGRLRFLIADDNADQRALLSELLARCFAGAVVEAVGDGVAALASIERRVPTVAIVDLDMPAMNGVELTAALRGQHATRELPIVVMTGVGGGRDWQALQRMGVEHFVVKPAVPSQLLGILRQITERAEAQPEA